MTSCLTYVRRQQGVPVLSHVVPPNEAHFLSLSHHLSGQITENSPENPGFLPKKRFYIHVS